tara:strand:+ start:192 stop:476 length:285 start_codon:yes stop_codon:yes gene_type:complete
MVDALDPDLTLASHWVAMNSLEQFLTLAVQNAESATPPAWFIVVLGLFIFVIFAIALWLVVIIGNRQRRRMGLPNVTAKQFWRAMFQPGSGGGD